MKPRNSNIPKVLIITSLTLLILATLAGGGWWFHSQEVEQLQTQLEETKKENSTLKSAKFGSTTGQGLSLAGSSSSDVIDGNVYTGQVAVSNNQLLFEMYTNTAVTGKIVAVWVNYGGNQESLVNQTDKTTEGLSGKQEGFTQMVAIASLADFEAGSSYMYRLSAQNESGKIYKSGYSIFSVPAANNQPAISF